MKTKDQILKIRAAFLYILSKYPEGIDRIKAFKILYFAQRKHLATYGRGIVDDTFYAQDRGPVPGFIYSGIRKLENKNEINPDFRDFLKGIYIEDKLLKSEVKPDLDELSKSDIRYLDEYIEYARTKTSDQLSEESHDQAWEKADARRKEDPQQNKMTLIEIAKAGGCTEGMAKYIKQNLLLDNTVQASERKHVLLDRLESLKALNDGWYGNNSYAVEDMAYANAKLLIESVPVETLIHWVLFANKNGTLAFRRKSAPITNFTIGNKEYGYIIISLDNRLISGKDKFDIETAKALFIELSK